MQVKIDGKLKEYRSIKRQHGVVLPLVQEHLLRVGDAGQDPSVVHPSEMSKPDWCIRATAQRITTGIQPPDDKFNFILQNIYAEGTAIHEKWQSWLGDTGRLWGDWRCAICKREITGTTPPAWVYPMCGSFAGEPVPHIWRYREVSLAAGLISGHEDAAIDTNLVEFKSIGVGTLRVGNPDLLKKHAVKTRAGKTCYDTERIWQGVRGPFRTHMVQSTIYLWLAQQMGLPFTKVSIVYEHKYDQRTKEFEIGLNMKLIDPLLAKVERIEYALATMSVPACEFGGCKKCEEYTSGAEGVAAAEVPGRHAIRRRYTQGG